MSNSTATAAVTVTVTLPGRLHTYLLTHPRAVTGAGIAALLQGAEIRARGIGTAAYADTTPAIALRLADGLEAFVAAIRAGKVETPPMPWGDIKIVHGKIRRAVGAAVPIPGQRGYRPGDIRLGMNVTIATVPEGREETGRVVGKGRNKGRPTIDWVNTDKPGTTRWAFLDDITGIIR